MTRLEEANYYQQQIKELKYFLETVVLFDRKSTSRDDTILFMTKTVKVSVSFLGIRSFGIGKHEQTIHVPDYIRNDLIESCKTRLQEFEDKLESIVGSNN